MAKKMLTAKQLKTELIRRHKRARLDHDEMLTDHGDESSKYLWAKCKLETIESAIWLIDPEWQED